MMLILEKLIKDPDELVRDQAIIVVGEMRKVVRDDEKEYIMKLVLELAHDTSDKLRESAVKLLNELAPDMGQQLCEVFIAVEFLSMGMDPVATVRQAVARNLVSVSKCVSMDIFVKRIFPLYKDMLTKDKEEKVRKTCADIVAEFTQVSPIERTSEDLQNLYFNFLQDGTSKIVRGTAFQNIGPFIACFKEKAPIDHRIISFFINTTEKTTSKDVTYYASINFPAFIYVTGPAEWSKYRALYLKLAQSPDPMTKKTIACSVHELARILGLAITEEDLIDVVDRFLKDNSPDVRNSVLKNLHIFLENVNPKRRNSYLTQIVQAFNEANKREWRNKEIFAKNLHKYVELFSHQAVQNEFLPMFFKFTEERTAAVREAAATAFAALIQKFEDEPAKQLQLISKIKKQYREGSYKKRQLYLIMSASVMQVFEMKQVWLDHFKEDTVSLADDNTPNVKIALARVLRHHYKHQGHFMDDRAVKQIVTQLFQDDCEDVRLILISIAGDAVQDSSSELSSSVANEDQKTEEPENRSSAGISDQPNQDQPVQQIIAPASTEAEGKAENKEEEVENKEEEVDVEKLLAEAEEEQFAHLENKQDTTTSE